MYKIIENIILRNMKLTKWKYMHVIIIDNYVDIYMICIF